MDATDELAVRRLRLLRDELAVLLARDGSVVRATAGLTVGVDHWQDAARAAGAHLERGVRTGTARGGAVVLAVVTDWPRTAEELRRAGRLAAGTAT